MSDSPNATIVRSYLAALEAGATGKDLARFFTPDAEQVELPNKLNPTGGRSDLPTLLRQRNYDCFTMVTTRPRCRLTPLSNVRLHNAVGPQAAQSRIL